MRRFYFFIFVLTAILIGTGAIVYAYKIAIQDSNDKKSNSSLKTVKDEIYKSELACQECNLILLSVDSLRADHVSAYGYERQTTPTFDQLAQKGALFLNYFTASYLTPVSEMAVHSGMYPSASGVTNFDTVLPDDRTTLVQLMKDNGYATSALLSSPEFQINPIMKKNFSKGFDRYEYVEKIIASDLPATREFPSADRLKEEIKSLEDGKFFWWIAVGGVHWPYGLWGENIYADSSYEGVFKDKLLDWDEFENIYKGKKYPNKTDLSKKDIQYVMDQYDNGVRAFDIFLKNLMDELQTQGLLDNTILVIQSEHGEDMHEHGYFAHYDVMDTQIHTPLLIISPSITEGMNIKSFAGSVDVFSTILEMLGYQIPSQAQGQSLLSVLDGREKDGLRQEVYLERNPLWEETFALDYFPPYITSKNRATEAGVEYHKDLAIRTNEWKYILRTSSETMEKISWWKGLTGENIAFPKAELFDLVNDPMETSNVIEQHPDTAAALRQKLETWFKKVTSDSPLNVKHEPLVQPYF